MTIRSMTALVALSALTIGCTTGPYAVSVRSATHPECDQRLAALARALPYDAAYPVRVVREAPLAGTWRGEDGHPIVPLETMGRYRYLGDVESARAASYPSQAFASVLWMPRMHETTAPALQALCWAQAPLRAMTLGVWAVLAPTSWPCFALYGGDDDELHLQELRRAAFAMGANTILLKDRETELVLTKSRRVVSTGAREMAAYAFVDAWAGPSTVSLDDAAADRVASTAAACWSLPASMRVVRR